MKKSVALLAALPLVLPLAACGSDSSGSEGVRVVASFYPLQFVAERVGGDLVDVDNLTQPGGEPHDLELAPKQVGAVQDADLVIYQEHFQSAVDAAVEQADRDADGTLDVATVVTTLPAEAGGDGHDHGDESTEEHEEHADDAFDPHTWLDPDNMIAITEAVGGRLADLDPDHASTYEANTAELVAELTTLGDDLDAGLARCSTRTIVTSHAAFGYLAARHDLTQVSIAGIDPSNEPTTGQLAEITELVREQGITTVFTEELVSPAIARTVADETGATTATLDPIEGLSDDTADETYLTLMRRNLTELEKANDCT